MSNDLQTYKKFRRNKRFTSKKINVHTKKHATSASTCRPCHTSGRQGPCGGMPEKRHPALRNVPKRTPGHGFSHCAWCLFRKREARSGNEGRGYVKKEKRRGRENEGAKEGKENGRLGKREWRKRQEERWKQQRKKTETARRKSGSSKKKRRKHPAGCFRLMGDEDGARRGFRLPENGIPAVQGRDCCCLKTRFQPSMDKISIAGGRDSCRLRTAGRCLGSGVSPCRQTGLHEKPTARPPPRWPSSLSCLTLSR